MPENSNRKVLTAVRIKKVESEMVVEFIRGRKNDNTLIFVNLYTLNDSRSNRLWDVLNPLVNLDKTWRLDSIRTNCYLYPAIYYERS